MGDTVASLCDLSASLQNLPAEPLRDLLARVAGQNLLEGVGPIDMLKVFISGHLSDDVEDRLGRYSERKIAIMPGKDFMLTLSFDRKMGSEALEVSQFISSRLVHWNRHYEGLLCEKAIEHGVQEIVNSLEARRAATAGPGPATSPKGNPKKWWQFWS